MSRLSTLAVSTLVPALNVLSTTLPDRTALSLVRTKAGPLPGLTCWNSTTDQSWLSMLRTMPFFRSLVEATRKSLSSYGLTGRRRQRADLPVEVCRGSLSMVAGGGRPPRTWRPPPVATAYGAGLRRRERPRRSVLTAQVPGEEVLDPSPGVGGGDRVGPDAGHLDQRPEDDRAVGGVVEEGVVGRGVLLDVVLDAQPAQRRAERRRCALEPAVHGAVAADDRAGALER